ncbi:MAG: polysaccharide pyruvyl transferase CsaB [Bacillota bacterium]
MRVVHLISGGDTGGARTHVLLLVRVLGERIPVLLVCLTPGEFYRDAREMDLPVVLLEQKRRSDLSVASRLRNLLDEFDADLLHCHGARANFLAALIRRRITIPTVTTIHSDYRRDFEDNLYKHVVYTALNSLSLRSFDYLLAVTDQFRDMLIERRFSPERIFTVYNGLDFSPPPTVDEQRHRRAWGIPPEARVVGTVGRLAKVKRQDVFVRAAALLAPRCPDVHFAIVGDGDEADNLRRQVRELGLDSRVTFTGHIDDVDAALSIFDVNTLVSESESFPYALLEGARRAVPAVATPVGGVPDLVTDGQTGLLVPVGDHEALARAIEKLLRCTQLRQVLGRNLFDHARHNFSLKAMRDRHLAIYRKITCGPAATPAPAQKVVVSGYFGFGNTGDEALLQGLLTGLKKRANLEVTVLSAHPARTASMHGVEAVDRFSPAEILRTLRGADLFISGGGTLLQDETSLRSLIYYALLIHLAHWMGAPVMLYANGLGPLRSRTGKMLARRCLGLARGVTLRDRDSLRLARDLGVTRAIEVTADPAFCLNPAPEAEAGQVLREAGVPVEARPAIISLRPWGTSTGRVAQLAARGADLLHRNGYYPVFYAMQPQQDGPVCQRAAALSHCPSAVIARAMRPALALALMARAQLTVGMRLHALILSTAVGVPPVGLSYDPKIEGFLAEIGAPCAGHVGRMEYDQLERTLTREVLPHLNRWRDQIETASGRLRRRAERNNDLALSLLETE